MLYKLKLFCFIFLAVWGSASCSKAPSANEFAPPQLGTVQVQAQDCFSVVLQGSMQQPVGEMPGGLVYGFYYGTEEDNLTRVVAKGGQSNFLATVDGLSFCTNYVCLPFMKNGELEVTGPAMEFRTLDPFDDAVFRSYIMENFDSDGNGGISRGEAEKVREIRIDSAGVGSLKGIEVFPYIAFLSCCNNSIKELDLSHCPELFSLEIQCADNMEEVDVSCCPKLVLLHAYGCRNLKTIYISQGQTIDGLRKEEHTALLVKGGK